MNGLKILNVDFGIEWAMLIAYYRGYLDEVKGTPIYEKYANMAKGYDVIVGYVADDRMYRVMTSFFQKEITDLALINSLKALDLGKQYVAISQKAYEATQQTGEAQNNDSAQSEDTSSTENKSDDDDVIDAEYTKS